MTLRFDGLTAYKLLPWPKCVKLRGLNAVTLVLRLVGFTYPCRFRYGNGRLGDSYLACPYSVTSALYSLSGTFIHRTGATPGVR